jgi:predicted house-cleaning noncanonical NTP pyrophosphatase (MazG superfamily)
VLEVLKGIASELSLPWADIESAAAQKRAERGGFEAGIWLQLPPEA